MNEADVYIDSSSLVKLDSHLDYLYDSEPIPESLLPPIFYAKKGDKRMKLDSGSMVSPKKQANISSVLTPNNSVNQLLLPSTPNAMSKVANTKTENILMTRPLFDKPNAALIKLRRDVKMQKLKGWPTFKIDVIKSTLPIQPEISFDRDYWLPNDDFTILHTLQVVLELPLSLQVIAPGHQPNWDMISDFVSSNYSNSFRSAFDCKKRFENVILKREEMCLTELQTKKQLQQQQLNKEQKINDQNNKYKQPAKAAVSLLLFLFYLRFIKTDLYILLYK
jgi:E1A-binding protein p400